MSMSIILFSDQDNRALDGNVFNVYNGGRILIPGLQVLFDFFPRLLYKGRDVIKLRFLGGSELHIGNAYSLSKGVGIAPPVLAFLNIAKFYKFPYCSLHSTNGYTGFLCDS